jgi:hypothetical protein
MTLLGALLTAIQLQPAATVPLQDRCQIADAILQAKGTQTGQMKVFHMRLIDEAWIDKRTRRNGKTILRGVVHRKKRAEVLFSSGDTCGDQAFLLEHQVAPLDSKKDPAGSHDMVVEIHLWPAGNNIFRFVERLNLSKQAYCSEASGPGCGIAVPPARLEGKIEKKDGSWSAKVTKSTFAS